MLDNLKIMLAGKDPVKLVEIFARDNPDQLYKLYSKKPELREQIIKKLFELKEHEKLIALARHDQERRVEILEEMLKNNCIKLDESIAILSWLNISIIHNKIIQNISYRLQREDIIRLLKSSVVKIEAKKMLQELTDIDLEKESDRINQEYLKLKMISEDSDFIDIEKDHDLIGHPEYINPESPLLINFYNLEYSRRKIFFGLVNNFFSEMKEGFQPGRGDREKTIDRLVYRKIKKVNNFYRGVSSTADAILYKMELFSLIFILNNLDISAKQFREYLKRIEPIDIFFPEYYQLFCHDFITNDCRLVKLSFFSNVMHKKIDYVNKLHPCNDLYYLSQVYLPYQGIASELPKIHMISLNDAEGYFQKHFQKSKVLSLHPEHLPFFKEFGYDMLESVPYENMKRVLIKASTKQREELDSFIAERDRSDFQAKYDNENYEYVGSDDEIIVFLALPLLIVGGRENYDFILQILEKTCLSNSCSVRLLSMLLETIAGDETDLIALHNNSDNNDNYFKKLNLDLESYVSLVSGDLDEEDENYINQTRNAFFNARVKTQICKYIRKFNLDKYKPLILNLLQDSDCNVQISALLSLYELDKHEAIPYIHDFIETDSTILKMKLAEVFHFFYEVIPPVSEPDFGKQPEDELAYSFEVVKKLESIDEATMLRLTEDESLDVIDKMCVSLTKLPKQKALHSIMLVIESGYYRNFSSLASSLTRIPSKEILRLLVDLLKDFDSEVYKSVIRALAYMTSLTSINYLKNIKLKNNILLEIERLRALIILGEYDYWNSLRNMLSLNISYFKSLGKAAVLELSNLGEKEFLTEMTQEKNDIFSLMSLAKLSMLDLDFFVSELDRFENLKRGETKYYYTLMLTKFPYEMVKSKLENLYATSTDYLNGYDLSIRTLIAIFFVKQNISTYIKEIERDIILYDDSCHVQITKAIKDLPDYRSYMLVEKIALFMNKGTLEDVFEICINCSQEQFVLLLLKVWKLSKEEEVRMICAKYFSRVNSQTILKTIKYELPRNPDCVQAELAYSLISLGDQSGWDILDRLLTQSLKKKDYSILDVIVRLRNKRGLELLKKHLANPLESVQSKIIKAIGSMRMKEAIPVLKKYSSDISKSIKISLAKAIGDMKYPELFSILEQIEKDPDEYVRTSAQVAKQKISTQSDLRSLNYTEILNKTFEKENWRLTRHWHRNIFQQFERKFKSNKVREIDYFKNKVIIESLAKKPKELNLSEVALKGDLVKTVLSMKTYDIDPVDWEIVKKCSKNKNEDYAKAILLISGNDIIDIHSPNWYVIFEIMDLSDANSTITDLFIYSLANKLSGKSLLYLVRFIEYERARYYFIFLANMLTVHISRCKLEDLVETRKELKSYQPSNHVFADRLINDLTRIIDNLVKIKNDEKV